MTFKELLLSCEFEQVATYLRKIYDLDSITHFKEAFDILRHTEAVACEGKIHIYLDETEEEDKYIDVSGLHDVRNKEALGRELQVDANISSLAEIAAHCLWEITFFGFSDEEKEDLILKWHGIGHTVYSELAFNLEVKNNLGMIYSGKRKKESKKYIASTKIVVFPLEIIHEIEVHTMHCNRSKRKRNYRQNKRIEFLNRKEKEEWLIQKLTRNPAPHSFTRNDLSFISSTIHCSEYKFHSYSYDAMKRTAYLRELIEKYLSSDFSSYNRLLVLVTTSPKHPLRKEESLDFINDLFAKGKPVQWGYNYNEKLREEMIVLVVLFE